MYGYILVNFRTKKVVHTFSRPGRPLFEKYRKENYENVGSFYGFNPGFTVAKRYNKNRPKGTFA